MTPDRATNARVGVAGNVLITAAGRRVTLVRAFAAAARERGARVLAADVDGLAPALVAADEAVRSLITYDPRYVDDLLESVVRHGIRLVVPTIDTDLPVLAHEAARFAEVGCTVVISTPAFIEVTRDKYETGLAFAHRGVAVPRSWIPPLPPLDELPTRVFVKPRAGSASQDTFEVDRGRLSSILPLVGDPVVQELLTGPEITIDALLDLAGRPIHFVPRRRIRTLGGESVQGVTLDHDQGFEAWISEILDRCSDLGALGPLTLQAFRTPAGPVLSEINARFGGGFPLGLEAGADYPRWLLAMVDGETVDPSLGDYEPGVFMTRYHVEHFTRHPSW